MSPTSPLRLVLVLVLVLVAGLSTGCRQDMHDQPKLEPYEASSFFADGRASRPRIEGTIPRGSPLVDRDTHLEDGKDAQGKLVATFPYPVTKDVLERGRERYDIYCAPCHAKTGDGDGMIVRRGYRRPPSMHEARLREISAGHLFDVMTNGFGAMPDYRAQIATRDRWAIVAYIRALQASRAATIADVPADQRAALEAAK
jgi:mono/diheme cytochrome c family protein